MNGRWLLPLLAAALLSAVPSARAQDEAEPPRIFLEKKVFAEDRKGKKSFYEVHTVTQGESLWKILRRIGARAGVRTADLLADFARANPDVTDPGRLRPGQKILVPQAPSARPSARETPAGAVPYKVVKGDALIKILSSRGVPRREVPRYLDAVRKLNPSIRDVNVIIAGRTIFVPTADYFAPRPPAPPAEAQATVALALHPAGPNAPAEEAKEKVAPGAPAPAVSPFVVPAGEGLGPFDAAEREAAVSSPSPPSAADKSFSGASSSGPLLTKTPPAPPPGAAEEARPQAQLVQPQPSPPAGASLSAPEAAAPKEERRPRPRPAYRGLLMDVVRGLGETWHDRGILYLPISAGGEVTIDLGEHPLVRFTTGSQAIVDFSGSLGPAVQRIVTGAWSNFRVVSVEDAPDPAERIGRLLAAAGYHSVKDGTGRPLVIGEPVSVELPARFVVLKTDKSLLSGEVFLVKEVPEKPPADLAAVIAYAERVGIHVIPYAVDPAVREGFVVGIDQQDDGADTAPLFVPAEPLAAVDFALDFLGIPREGGRRIQAGGGRASFQLTVEPDRVFEIAGKRYVVDAGRMSAPVLSLLRESGYVPFVIRGKEAGISAFRRVLQAAGVELRESRGELLAGGEEAGYAVRVTGSLLAAPGLSERRKARAVALVRGKVHPSARGLLRALGVEIIGW